MPYIDRFLRVEFTDENERIPAGNAERISDLLNSSEGIYGRMRRLLKHGLVVGGCHYIFLACSESQMKEQAFWAIREEQSLGFTRDAIHQWMGQINDKIPSK